MFFESKRIPKWSDKNLYELIQKVVSQELSSPRVVNLVEDTTKNVNYFYNEFYEKYATLKKTVSRHVVDKNASSIVLNAEHTVGDGKDAESICRGEKICDGIRISSIGV